MLSSHRIALVAMLAASLLAGSLALRPARAADAPPTQLAVINVVNVFSKLNQKLDGDAEIEKLDDDINKKRVKMEEDIKKLGDSLKNPMFKLDSPEYKKVQEDLLDASANYEAFLRASETRHLMLVRLKTAEIYRAINAAVEKHAKAKGIAIVFVIDDIDLNAKNQQELTSKIAMRKILYAHPNFDITKEIIEAMNTDYRLGSGGK